MESDGYSEDFEEEESQPYDRSSKKPSRHVTPTPAAKTVSKDTGSSTFPYSSPKKARKDHRSSWKSKGQSLPIACELPQEGAILPY